MKLITPEINSIVSESAEQVDYNAKGKSYDNYISNSFLAEAGFSEVVESLQTLATYLGIDFGQTEHTYSVDYTRTANGLYVYESYITQPSVIRCEGTVGVQWGKVFQPLNAIPNRVTFVKEGFIQLSCGEEGDEPLGVMPVAVKQEYKNLEATKFNKLKKDGNLEELGQYLRPTRKRTHPTKVEKNVKLRVYPGAEINRFGKYELEVQGHGIVVANTSLHNQYRDLVSAWDNKPALKQYPVYVTFGENYATDDGKQCVRAKMVQDIPIAKSGLSAFMKY